MEGNNECSQRMDADIDIPSWMEEKKETSSMSEAQKTTRKDKENISTRLEAKMDSSPGN